MARRGFCPGTAPTCSISNVSFKRSTRASRCLTGASTSPRQTSLHATSSASPIRSAPSSSARPTRCSSGEPTACRGLIAGPSSTPPRRRPAFAPRRRRWPSATQYPAFRTMEGNPHGSAHTSFGGSISSIPTAARDPLFFLLHCNVDRLWAKWQRQFGRFNPAQAASYDSNPGESDRPQPA